MNENDDASAADVSSSSSRKNVIMDSRWMGEIRPGLWIGNLQSVTEISKQLLPDVHWTVISILKSEKLFKFVRTALHGKHVVHIEWEMSDESQANFISPKLADILNVIDKSIIGNENEAETRRTGCCLVHCAFGVSRSAAICAAWLISRHKLTLAQSLAAIRKVRPDASPKMGFIAGLRALQECNGTVESAMQRIRPEN